MKDQELVLNILRFVEIEQKQMSLSKRLGISLGKTNYVLNALIDKGLIKVENFVKSEDKKRYRYLLTPKGVEEKIALTKKFIQRKKREYEELQRELERIK